MADELERDLRDSLMAEASRWSPESPVSEIKRLLPERIARRRRQQEITGITALLAVLLMVALVAAAPARGPLPSSEFADRLPGRSTTSPATTPAPGQDDVCQAACGSPAPSAAEPPGTPGGPATSVTSVLAGPQSGSSPSQPDTAEPPASPLLPPPSPPTWPGTAPPGSTVPTVVVPTVPPTTTISPPPVTVHVFTLADFGHTRRVNAGDRIIVNLAQCQGAEWTQPDTSAAPILTRLSASIDVGAGTASAMFFAGAGGRADIMARVVRSPCLSPTATPDVLTIKVIG